MWDVSLCSNEKCKKYNECIRGGAERHVGIYTVSDFSKECDEVTNYAWFIPKDLKWKV